MIKAGRREYVQVLRLLEAFAMEDLHVAVKNALRIGAVGFDAIIRLSLHRTTFARKAAGPRRHTM